MRFRAVAEVEGDLCGHLGVGACCAWIRASQTTTHHSTSTPSSSPSWPRGQSQGLVCYVLHTGKTKLHGYTGGPYSLCRQWKCGERDRPSMDALFVPIGETDLIHFEACRSCESQQRCAFPKSDASSASRKASAPRRASSSSAQSLSSSCSSASS